MTMARFTVLLVGDELVEGRVEDSNLPFLRDVLEDMGMELSMAIYVRDEKDDISRGLALGMEISEVVITAGGLGPTEDDLTAEAVAEALGRRLVRNHEAAERIESLFRRMGREMPPSNLKQADLVEGAVPIYSGHGTAPGQFLEIGEKRLILLPGVPSELRDMVHGEVVPRLAPFLAAKERKGLAKKVIRIAGKPESEVADVVTGAASRFPGVKVTYRATPGVIEVTLKAEEELPEGLMEEIRKELGDFIVSEEGKSLEEALGEMLRDRGMTLSVAESCTGGLLGERITRVPGSSDYFLGGVVSYSYRAKSDVLGVPGELLKAKGAVNEEVALHMAKGARRLFGSDFALSVTGVAGPGTGGESEPVGTVVTGMATPGGEWAFRYRLPGERELVRQAASSIALASLLFHLRRG